MNKLFLMDDCMKNCKNDRDAGFEILHRASQVVHLYDSATLFTGFKKFSIQQFMTKKAVKTEVTEINYYTTV